MEFKKVKVSKRCNVTIEEDRFAINDLDGTERLVDDADTYYAFNKAVYWADNLRKFVAKTFEDKYITSLGIKKGDMVRVIAGKDKDREGKVLIVNAKKNTVVVEGINMITKHQKPSMANQQGGILQGCHDIGGIEEHLPADLPGQVSPLADCP